MIILGTIGLCLRLGIENPRQTRVLPVFNKQPFFSTWMMIIRKKMMMMMSILSVLINLHHFHHKHNFNHYPSPLQDWNHHYRNNYCPHHRTVSNLANKRRGWQSNWSVCCYHFPIHHDRHVSSWIGKLCWPKWKLANKRRSRQSNCCGRSVCCYHFPINDDRHPSSSLSWWWCWWWWWIMMMEDKKSKSYFDWRQEIWSSWNVETGTTHQCVTVPKMLDDTDTDTFFRY